MSGTNVDNQIANFLQRKHAEYPELALAGRNESRTVKYAQNLRASGQMLLCR